MVCEIIMHVSVDLYKFGMYKINIAYNRMKLEIFHKYGFGNSFWIA